MKFSAIGTKLLLCFATTALAIGSAATYHITLYQPSLFGGKEVKAGDYKLELKNHSAILKQGKTAIEAETKTETGEKKYFSNSVKYNVEGGKNNVEEIRLGGTKTKLVFEPGRSASGAF